MMRFEPLGSDVDVLGIVEEEKIEFAGSHSDSGASPWGKI
jgi:hypothetical protein